MSKTVQEIFRKPPVNVKASKLKSVSCSNPNILLGLEIEVENTREADAYFIQLLNDQWIVDHDGSLRGRSHEFKTEPQYLQFMIPELQQFYALTKFTDEANFTDRCSIHVHANALDYTQEQLATLTLVYPIIEEVLFEFVNHFNWKKDEQGACRDTNLYCIPWNQCRNNHKVLAKLFSKPKATTAEWQKYTALNLQTLKKYGTVEWRHMHGTADMEKLTLWLNIIGAIMGYAKRVPFEQALGVIKALNDNSAYEAFFNDLLQAFLPFNDRYRTAMYDGVVNAKYSMFGWDGKKEAQNEAPDAPDPMLDVAAFRALHAQAARVRPAPQAQFAQMDHGPQVVIDDIFPQDDPNL